MLLEIIIPILWWVLLGGVLGYWLRKPKSTPLPSKSLLAGKAPRCHTITYTYSNGEFKTFHRCQGHTEFTDRFGREVAPEGASLVSARGGVHGLSET